MAEKDTITRHDHHGLHRTGARTWIPSRVSDAIATQFFPIIAHIAAPLYSVIDCNGWVRTVVDGGRETHVHTEKNSGGSVGKKKLPRRRGGQWGKREA